MKTVREVLQGKTKEVWSVLPYASVFDALKLMGEKQIGALMVIDDKGKVAGYLGKRLRQR
jgi:CBS domain-containing protein